MIKRRGEKLTGEHCSSFPAFQESRFCPFNGFMASVSLRSPSSSSFCLTGSRRQPRAWFLSRMSGRKRAMRNRVPRIISRRQTALRKNIPRNIILLQRRSLEPCERRFLNDNVRLFFAKWVVSSWKLENEALRIVHRQRERGEWYQLSLQQKL